MKQHTYYNVSQIFFLQYTMVKKLSYSFNVFYHSFNDTRPITTRCLASFIFFLFFFSSSIYAGLSATTAKKIQGSAPYLELNNTALNHVNELLGFFIGAGATAIQVTSEQSINANPANVVTIPNGIKFSDIHLLINADGIVKDLHDSTLGLIVSDSDGDASPLSPGFVLGAMKAEFTDNGTRITNLQQSITSCGGPYKLIVTITQPISANTVYGSPSTNLYGSGSATYSLVQSDRLICNIKTDDMTVTTAGSNSSLFSINNGFSVSALKAQSINFPKTGFRNAKFTLTGSGDNQANYRCKLNNEITDITYVKLSTEEGSQALGSGCQITYTGIKIPHDIQIDMYYDSDVSTLIDSYTIPKPDLWAEGDGALLGYNTIGNFTGRYSAANRCYEIINGSLGVFTGLSDYNNVSKYFFTRAQLTNSTVANAGHYQYVNGSFSLADKNNPTATGGYFKRDADGTFMGEWGNLANYNLSPWVNSRTYYWTAEAYTSNRQYYVSSSGAVNSNLTPNSNLIAAVCKI